MIAKPVVKAIILNRRIGRILLLQRSKDDKRDPSEWENAGGSVEENEDLIAAVKREVMEETGISDLVVKQPPCYVVTVQKNVPDIIIVYLCETSSENVQISSEHQDYKWVGKEECKCILRGGIASDFKNNGIYDMSWDDEN